MKKILILALVLGWSWAAAQQAPVGSPVSPSEAEKKALEKIKGKLKGKIVWSTSRAGGKHDIWIMNADGTGAKALTKSAYVDWFPRISPDGNRVLFVRSKIGWVPETDADYHEKWDLWSVGLDGSGEKKIVENACWGTWRPSGEEIVFARGEKVFLRNLKTGEEKLLLDGGAEIKKGTIVQQPQMSPDGKYIAATLRGRSRETGIWDLEKKRWSTTGKGCQIDWFPSGKEIYRMNPTGNGGRAAPSEVLVQKVKDGVPVDVPGGLWIGKQFKLMDLPGDRSHEYFPKFDPSGEWMVWGATDKGHDHDIYDYELFLWKRGTDPKKDFTRLTFHSGNDRWPDIFIGEPKQSAPEMSPEENPTQNSEKPSESSASPASQDAGTPADTAQAVTDSPKTESSADTAKSADSPDDESSDDTDPATDSEGDPDKSESTEQKASDPESPKQKSADQK